MKSLVTLSISAALLLGFYALQPAAAKRSKLVVIDDAAHSVWRVAKAGSLVQLKVAVHYRVHNEVAFRVMSRRPERLVRAIVANELQRQVGLVHEEQLLLPDARSKLLKAVSKKSREGIAALRVGIKLERLELTRLQVAGVSDVAVSKLKQAARSAYPKLVKAREAATGLVKAAKARFQKAWEDANAEERELKALAKRMALRIEQASKRGAGTVAREALLRLAQRLKRDGVLVTGP